MVDFCPDHVIEGIWIGRCPRSPEDYVFLKAIGVQDILTLQTEEEARTTGLLPEVSFKLAIRHGIREHRLGIEDLCPSDLEEKGPAAVELLSKLQAEGRVVYVHCAAGLNRSPTVVAAYISWAKGMDPLEACDLVTNAHPSFPSADIVARIVKILRQNTKNMP